MDERLEIVASSNGNGTTYARGPAGRSRIFLGDGEESRWPQLSGLQRDSVCRLVWAAADGRFRVTDAATGETWVHHVDP